MKIATFMPVVTNLWEGELGELYRLEIRNGKKSLHYVTKQAKAKEEGRAKLTETVSAVDALVTSEQIAEPKLTSMEEPPQICAQREKCRKL